VLPSCAALCLELSSSVTLLSFPVLISIISLVSLVSRSRSDAHFAAEGALDGQEVVARRYGARLRSD
jgi:hypothetical protein